MPIKPNKDDVILAEGEDVALELMASDRARALRRDHNERLWQAHVEKREWIIDLMAIGLPVDAISKRTGVSQRLVNEIGVMYRQQLEVNARNMAKYFKRLSLKCAFYADQKASKAGFSELAVASGIFAQKGMELELASMSGIEERETIDVETENPALKSAREFVKQLGNGNSDCPVERSPAH